MAILGLAAAAGALFLLAYPERPPAPTGAWLRRAGVDLRFADVGGLRLRYVRRGTGRPVLLLHGIGSSVYTWADVIPTLAEDHDVVALDLPGFGGSDIPASFSGTEYLRVVLGFLDGLALHRVAVVGHSLGGAVACAVTAAEPERVERLVLVDSAGFNLAAADLPWLLRAAGSPSIASAVERLPVRRPLLELALHQVFYDDARVTSERVEEYLASLARPGAARVFARLLEDGDPGLPAAIARIRVPTLVVWGRDDRWIPVEDAERFVRAIPGSRKTVLERCGHLPQEERPEETARLLRDFLAS